MDLSDVSPAVTKLEEALLHLSTSNDARNITLDS